MINQLSGKVKEFAIACYDTNSIEDLELSLLNDEADETDCKTWNITSDEWFRAIIAAQADLDCED